MSLDAGSQGTSLSRNDIHVLLFWGDFFAAAAVEKSTFLRKGKKEKAGVVSHTCKPIIPATWEA
jgi:hypothetical protein